jgi:GNAT superfamily N-acetyltransferase
VSGGRRGEVAGAAGDGNALLIRPFAPSDLDEVVRLAKELGYPTSSAAAADRIAGISDSADHALLVADVREGDGTHRRVEGFIQICASQAVIHAPEAEIVSLVVSETARGRGTGAGLVRAAEAWARSRGMESVRVRCRVEREGAHRFYTREGFSRQKTQHVFTKLITDN